MALSSLVVADIVVREGNCNLACTYCLTGQSQFKDEHTKLEIFMPPVRLDCRPSTHLGRRLRALLGSANEAGLPVVKLSGGELLLVDGAFDLIEEASAAFETVVVLTNGLPLAARRLERLATLGNVVLQISIDATRLAGNSYRCPDEATHHASLARLHAALDSGIATEIYLVLHDRSMPTFADTLEDLAPWSGQVTVFPFPVRGPDRTKFQPRTEHLEPFFEVIDHAARHADLLPCRAYLERLQQFYADGGRTFRCHLPRIAFTAFDDGIVTNCPNIWFNQVDNLLQRPASVVFRALEEAPFRALLLAPRPRIDACRACFTPWDPVSLYFEDRIGLDDLRLIPMYRGPRTLAALVATKSAFSTAAREGNAPPL